MLPAWLPDWNGAADAVRDADLAAVRATARELVDLVLTEDSRYLDALTETVESAIVTPLAMLSEALDRGTDAEVLVAARLVRRSVEAYLAEAPLRLRHLVRGLPGPHRG
ncbi:hypothetical protein ACFPIJ_44520 [Dactylosporangium cerinum]|uniref:Uncharacterized protein n=1 Tax=Dactylosporangium cerinum TaxID=1434730 RepID=A0ABV9WAC3_9ACTN